MSTFPFRKLLPLLAPLYVLIISFTASPALRDESEAYFNYGRNLVTTGIYGVEKGISDDWREPGYGVFLGVLQAPLIAVEKITGTDFSQATTLRWIVFLQVSLFSLVLFLFHHYSQLPPRVRTLFLLIAALSPTIAGAHGAIYSETLVIDLLLLLILLVSRHDFLKSRQLAFAAFLASWLLLTKLYLMFLFPLFLAGGVFLLPRKHKRLLLVPALALLLLGAWNLRSRFVEKRQVENTRVVLQLAGKVYRHTTWNLREEWPAALLASCCSATCDRRYGPQVCEKFTFKKSDGMAYELLQDWRIHPENHEKNLLVEVLRTWVATFPMQLVSSGLEFIRMAFFEAATVTPDSSGLWRIFAQLWHVFGSMAIWLLAALGFRELWRKKQLTDPVVVLGVIFVSYHILFMSQVTNVQRYSVPLLPWFYLMAAWAIASCRKPALTFSSSS